MDTHERISSSSSSEDLFVEIFQDALGFERTQMLMAQYPFLDIDGRGRYIDFAFLSPIGKYAFEIDGEAWHAPDSPLMSPESFRDSLVRQNSLIHLGWKVFRWSDVQLAAERERVKEQLLLFLENEIATGTLDGFLPLQQAGEISLHDHQADALRELAELREAGKTIALVTHATGTGKTHTAIADARRMGTRTLYLAHRTVLLTQTQERFTELWPDASSAVFRAGDAKPTTQIVLATIQSMEKRLNDFDRREFGYVIVDEAHHAAAETHRKVLSYFRPKFTLGLTATDERHDGQSLIEIFQNTTPRLELEEAVARGLLVPIRCVRVQTNIDLTKIRFNGVDYRAADLGRNLVVPSRDTLIVDTYADHANGKRAVCFCIDVAHSERLATLFNERRIPAAHVSGRMDANQRQKILDEYRDGKILVLCACDILTEGWDSPETEVLLMARPTLSKVVYVQQLGRGTRKSKGKEYLMVFDFIDNTTRYAQAMNAHRLLRKGTYRPGALLAAPTEALDEEEKQFARGEKPAAVLSLNLWAERYIPVDIFRWQDEIQNMFQANELEIELGVGERAVRNWIDSGRIAPDHTIEMGNRVYHYFRKDRLDEIRSTFNLMPITPDTVRNQFLEFVREIDMTMSYKAVLLLGLLSLADSTGSVKMADLVGFFREFYLERKRSGRVVESPRSKMCRVETLTDAEIEELIVRMPLEKFERRKFIRRLKEISKLKFWEPLWKALTTDNKANLKHFAEQALEKYYARF